MSKSRELIRNIVVFGAGTFLAKLVQFLLLPLYTFYLSSDSYAEGELLNNLVELAHPLITLSIYEAVFRFTLSKSEDRSKVFSHALFIMGVTLAISGIACVGASLAAQDSQPLLFFALLLTCSLGKLFSFYARGSGFVIPFAISGVVNAASLAAFSYCFIVQLGLSSPGYVLALALSNLASVAYLAWATRSSRMLSASIRQRMHIDVDLCKRMLGYSIPLMGTALSFWFATMSSRYILALITGISAAGLYLAVVKLSAVINMIQQVFYYAFQINASKESEMTNDLAYLGRVYAAFSFSLIVISSLLMCFMPAIARVVLQGEFSVAAKYLPLALYAAFIDCLFCYFRSFYTSYKKTLRSMISVISGALVNIGLCFALIPALEIWGAMLALVISNAVTSMVRAVDTRTFVPIDQHWRSNAAPLFLIGVQAICLSLELSYSVEVCIALCALTITLMLFSYRRAASSLLIAFRKKSR